MIRLEQIRLDLFGLGWITLEIQRIIKISLGFGGGAGLDSTTGPD